MPCQSTNMKLVGRIGPTAAPAASRRKARASRGAASWAAAAHGRNGHGVPLDLGADGGRGGPACGAVCASRWSSSRCSLTTRPPAVAQTSWRTWGGIQTQQDAEAEAARIRGELDKLRAAADFPLTILPLAMGRNAEELASAKEEIASADVAVLYAAGGLGADFTSTSSPRPPRT